MTEPHRSDTTQGKRDSGRRELRVGPQEAGVRLDILLARHLGAGSRARARRALQRGKVLVDGHVVGRDAAGRMLPIGCVVCLDWNRPGTAPRPSRAREALERAGVSILFEDRHQIAVAKPAGLLADAATLRQRRERITLRDLLAGWLRPQGKQPFVVHRIDRDTSGVVLVAKTVEARDALRAQFRHYRTVRLYLTVVQGVPAQLTGVWRHIVRWDRRSRKLVPCTPGHRDAREAIATWRRVAVLGDEMAVLFVRLGTGRRNQIRAQAALSGHPVVGDPLYGRLAGTSPLRRQALHAWCLEWRHPIEQHPQRAIAPIPADLHRLLTLAWGRGRVPQDPAQLLDPPAPPHLP